MNNKNPFTELYGIMQESAKKEDSFFIAKVINPLPNLEVLFEGLELDKDNLMISKGLLLSNSAAISCSEGSITHNLKDVLSIGDTVLLYRMNDSTFMVLDKVVNI